MKRITGWPQAWLGLVFTWGAPVGWVEASGFDRLGALAALYAGCWAWCMAYDTIYALQDREDDAMVGIGSSALSFGRHVRAGVGGLYAMALLCWAGAIWQVLTLKEDGADPLVKFRSNRFAGLLMAAAAYVVGTA
jgi:4-hydroxybenzoate polyprenyltransferase